MKFPLYIISAALSLSICACSSKEKNDNEEIQKPVVKIEKVSSSQVVQQGNYTATVEPEIINNISSSSPNRIKEIYVDEGFNVAKGQKLVVLDDVNITTYETQVENAKANLANVEVNYQRAKELLDIGAGTRQNLDQMELQLINARNTLASAERTLKNVRENTVLVSPIDGVVTARNYDPGDMTGGLPIVTVARVNPVKIIINVSESELANVKKGMDAKVRFDTYGDEEFTGTITMVSPTIDTNTRTFGVEITMKNSDNRILPGMFGRVTLDLGTAQHVVVPDRAVVKQQGSGNHYVYVYKDGRVSYNKVELGQRLGNSYELLSGVEDGDEVVISGQTKLADGIEVEVSK